MGVSGSGKSTVASLLAKQTGAVFYEGDDFHPPENIAKMRAGIPLTDRDREHWLHSLRNLIEAALARNEFAVLTCSALKAKYRAVLQANDGRVQFVFLEGSPSLIQQRLRQRQGHFMPPSLLSSQFKILEPPADALTFSVEQTPQQIVHSLIRQLGLRRLG